jgi:hypothetical protein
MQRWMRAATRNACWLAMLASNPLQSLSGVRTWGDLKVFAPGCIISHNGADAAKVDAEELDSE